MYFFCPDSFYYIHTLQVHCRDIFVLIFKTYDPIHNTKLHEQFEQQSSKQEDIEGQALLATSA